MRHSLGLRRVFVIPLTPAACPAAYGNGSAAPPGGAAVHACAGDPARAGADVTAIDVKR
ncbi:MULTISPECIES: hypothetical protein [Streptomyces]|uniref:hypothetical protein n=1 Tax=Streptomyces TaxID=1883 RepID=UPI000B291BA1|nr:MULTISPECIES: hypothetical protein [Streptomyces]